MILPLSKIGNHGDSKHYTIIRMDPLSKYNQSVLNVNNLFCITVMSDISYMVKLQNLTPWCCFEKKFPWTKKMIHNNPTPPHFTKKWWKSVSVMHNCVESAELIMISLLAYGPYFCTAMSIKWLHEAMSHIKIEFCCIFVNLLSHIGVG